MTTPDTMQQKQITFIILLLLLFSTICLILVINPDFKTQEKTIISGENLDIMRPGSHVQTDVDQKHNNLTESRAHTVAANIYQDRVQRIKTMCASPNTLQTSSYKRPVKQNYWYFYSKSYNLSVCIIPKGGSTLWSQTFGILAHGANYSNALFNMSRLTAHLLTKQFKVPLSNVINSHSRTVLISRDPYTRLYSAFVDKIYVPELTPIRQQIYKFVSKSKATKHCPGDITFEQFVRWVIASSKMGGSLDIHWAPIYTMCRPCHIDTYMLIKLESFSEDVEYTLRKLGVENDKLFPILDAMHGKRVDSTIPGIIKEVYNYTRNYKPCFGKFEVEEKLWHSFQIQGYLDAKVRFPIEEFWFNSTNVESDVFFTKVLLTSIKESSISSTVAKLQRKTAVVKAYSDFSQDTIEGIKNLYHEDFVLFNYSLDPPTIES